MGAATLSRAGRRHRRSPQTASARILDNLPELTPVLDVPTAARLLGISRSAAYELIHTGQWPTPVLHLGRLIRIPTVHLLALVGLPDDNDPWARQP